MTTNADSHPLMTVVSTFLNNLANADRSVYTQRAYATELRRLTVFHPSPITTITPTILRAFFAQHGLLRPPSRARMQSA